LDGLFKYLIEQNDKNFRKAFIKTYFIFTNAKAIANKLKEAYENLSTEEKEINQPKESTKDFLLISPREKKSTMRMSNKSRIADSLLSKRISENDEEEQTQPGTKINNIIKIIRGKNFFVILF
jgi:flagellar biosynthesis GTPase FlhF